MRDPAAGSPWEQFTSTDGGIHDFFPSPDGEQVIYSAENDLGGMDLWIIQRDGANLHRLQDCVQDICDQVAWSPDAKKIAFVRGNSLSKNDAAWIEGGIWLLDLETNISSLLFEKPQTLSLNPAWSPDGMWLSCWSENSKEITLYNHSTEEQISLEASKGDTDCWSSDSRYIYYPVLEFQQAAFHQVIRKADLANNTLQTVIGGEDERAWLNYDNFACHPRENKIAVTVQSNVKLPGKQLISVDLQTGERMMISDDLASIPSNLRWSPAGDRLLFQINRFAADELEQTLWIWDQLNGHLDMLGEQLHSPAWLP